MTPFKHYRANSEYSSKISVKTREIEDAINNETSNKNEDLPKSYHKRNLSLQDNDYLQY